MSDYLIKLRFMYSFNCMESCNTQKVLRTFLILFVHFFCVAQKKWTKEKGTAARGLSRQNYRALLRNDCDSLRLFSIRLRRMIKGFFSHSSFAVVLCKPSIIYLFNIFCHYYDFPVIPANAGISSCLIKFLHSTPLSKRIICSASYGLFWV